jgi:hypothetical protein
MRNRLRTMARTGGGEYVMTDAVLSIPNPKE